MKSILSIGITGFFAVCLASSLSAQNQETCDSPPAWWLWRPDAPCTEPFKSAMGQAALLSHGDKVLAWKPREPLQWVGERSHGVPSLTQGGATVLVYAHDKEGHPQKGLLFRWRVEGMPDVPYPMCTAFSDEKGLVTVALSPGEEAELWCDEPALEPSAVRLAASAGALDFTATPARTPRARLWDGLGRDAGGAVAFFLPLEEAADPLREPVLQPLFACDRFGRCDLKAAPGPGVVYLASPVSGVVVLPCAPWFELPDRLPLGRCRRILPQFRPNPSGPGKMTAKWRWSDPMVLRLQVSLEQVILGEKPWVTVPGFPCSVTVSVEGYGSREVILTDDQPEPIVVRFTRALAIGGTILEDEEKPVCGATIQINQKRTKTNARGEFLFTDLAREDASSGLRAEAEGFLPAETPLAGRTDLTRLRIILKRGAGVTGQVIDSLGSGISGATVYAEQADGERNRVSSRTNGEGVFSLTGLERGAYSMKIRATGFGDWATTLPEELNGVTDLGRIRLGDLPNVRGSLQDERGTPQAGCSVRLEEELTHTKYLEARDESLPVGETDEGGNFMLGGLAPGRYTLLCGCPGGHALSHLFTMAKENLDLGVLTALASGRIEGILSGEEDGPPIPALVKLLAQPMDPSPRVAFSGGDGRVLFEGCPPGDYYLVASIPERFKGPPPVRVTVRPGETATAFLRLGGIEARFLISVRGLPVSYALLSVRPAYGFDRDPGVVMVSAGDGSKSFVGLPPASSSGQADASGMLMLADLSPGPAVAEMRWEGMEYRLPFLIPDSPQVSLPLDFQGLSVAGQVVLPDGKPAPNAFVSPRFEIAGIVPGAGTPADPEGHFTVDGLGEGTVTLVARDDGGYSGESRVTLKRETVTAPVRIELHDPAGK